MAEHHSGGVEQAVGAVGRAVQLLGEAQMLVAGADIFVAHAGSRRQLRILQETVHQLQQLAAGKTVFPKLQAQRVVVPDALGGTLQINLLRQADIRLNQVVFFHRDKQRLGGFGGELLPIIVSGH